MKNRIAILFCIVFAQLAVSQEFKFGGGVTLGTEASIDDDFSGKSAFGINLRGLYKITPKWGITAGANYFFASAPDPIDPTVYQFNFDGTYSFVAKEQIDFYGLFGVGLGYAKVKNSETNQTLDDSQVGIELGLGVITRSGIFFEVKAEGAYEQGQFTLGYLF